MQQVKIYTLHIKTFNYTKTLSLIDFQTSQTRAPQYFYTFLAHKVDQSSGVLNHKVRFPSNYKYLMIKPLIQRQEIAIIQALERHHNNQQ